MQSLSLLFIIYFPLQGKGRLRRGNYPCPSSPVVVRLPSVSDVPEETLTNEAAMETDITEQQQAAMQQEERVLTEQIENLQKEKWVSRRKRSNQLSVFISFLLSFLYSSLWVRHCVRWYRDVEMTKTCCLYSGNSVKVVTLGEDGPWAKRPEAATVTILEMLTGTGCISLSQGS